MAAFDGGKSSVADMSFTQLAISTDGPCVKTTEALHHPGRSENEKAMKPYGQQSPMQGSGYWMSSEVSENVGSLDVNYPYKASQNGCANPSRFIAVISLTDSTKTRNKLGGHTEAWKRNSFQREAYNPTR